jgi:hypothetical protein
MRYFSNVSNGVVTQVIAANSAPTYANGNVITSWVETSTTTRNNRNYGVGGKDVSATDPPLRGNYGAVGYIYDSKYDVFYPPQPSPEFILDTSVWGWVPPKAYPSDPGNNYSWSSSANNWVITGKI